MRLKPLPHSGDRRVRRRIGNSSDLLKVHCSELHVIHWNFWFENRETAVMLHWNFQFEAFNCEEIVLANLLTSMRSCSFGIQASPDQHRLFIATRCSQSGLFRSSEEFSESFWIGNFKCFDLVTIYSDHLDDRRRSPSYKPWSIGYDHRIWLIDNELH